MTHPMFLWAAWPTLIRALLAPGLFLPLGIGLALIPAYVLYLFYTRQRDRRLTAIEQAVSGASRRAMGRSTHPLDRTGSAPDGAPSLLAGAAKNIEEEREETSTRAIVAVTPLVFLTLAGFGAAQVHRCTTYSEATARALPLFAEPWVGLSVVGFLGAYLYVITLLGRRILLHDISKESVLSLSSILLWGAVLGALVPKLPFIDHDGVTDHIVAFCVGAFPSLAQRYVSRAVARVLGDTQAFPARRPLEQLSGMTPEVIDRLAEEEILDAQHLAAADPVRLMYRLPYGLGLIVDWIDEALLFRYVGPAFQNRAAAGLTGAMDLALQWALFAEPTTEKPEGHGPPSRLPASDTHYAPLDELARTLGMTVDALWRVGYGLYYDRQLTLLWALYTARSAAAEADPPEPKPPGT